jgi:transcriptional regulator with XRE-family HTH domain
MLRALRGYSQEEVAETLRRLGHDWSQTTVSQVELGARHVNVDELFALALTMSVNPGELLSPVFPTRLMGDFGVLKVEGLPTHVDVGTAKPLPRGFVKDWLYGEAGHTQLRVDSHGELQVLTGRLQVVGDKEPDQPEPQP